MYPRSAGTKSLLVKSASYRVCDLLFSAISFCCSNAADAQTEPFCVFM